MKIIDIQETQLVSFTVKWAAHRQWLQMGNVYVPYTPAGSSLDTTDSVYNGYIGVVPMNKLTSPDGSSVSILVHVQSDNMHFNYMTDSLLPNKRRIVTSSRTLNSIDCDRIDLNESTATTKNIATDHFGEQPLSFRALLKRYMHVGAQSVASAGSVGSTSTYLWKNYPVNNVPYASSPSGSAMRNLWDYLRYAYVGIRGSVRSRFQVITTVQADYNVWYLVATSSVAAGSAESATNSITGSFCGFRGTGVFTPYSNTGVEVEIPFYSDNLFVFAFADTYDGSGVGTFDSGDMNNAWVRNHSFILTTDQITKTIAVGRDFAAGEDFDLIRFQGAPYFST